MTIKVKLSTLPKSGTTLRLKVPAEWDSDGRDEERWGHAICEGVIVEVTWAWGRMGGETRWWPSRDAARAGLVGEGYKVDSCKNGELVISDAFGSRGRSRVLSPEDPWTPRGFESPTQ